MDMAIRTVSLTKVFKKKERKPKHEPSKGKVQQLVAVDHLNLSIPRGTLFGLLGPNGAGKTTTIKLLSTLLLPEEGTAYVNGFDIVKEPNHVRSSIGVVAGGERGLYWRLTGRENLLFFARLYGVREDKARPRINELLKLVDLVDRADDRVETYSKGMKQRLHLIRGLVHDPPILLLDEPTLGLDPNSAVVVRGFIKEKLQGEQGKTILLTTHYMEEADQLCNQIAIIDHGRIITEGSPSDLKARMKKIDTMRINATKVPASLSSDLKSVEGVEDLKVTEIDPVTRLTEILIHTKDAEQMLPHLTETLVRLGVQLHLIEQLKPSLEDVFIMLTGRGLRD